MSSRQKGSVPKELKIEAKHAITIDDLVKNKDAVKLLYLIGEYGEISEKALQALVKEIVDKGGPINYKFITIGDISTSKKLRDDIVALLYLGLLELNSVTKKIRVTGEGKEFLEKEVIKGDEREKLKLLLEEVKNKIISIDAEYELSTLLSRRRRGRRRF